MKNYKKLVPIYLKQQYKRTISVAAAIIMATALIICMVTLGRSHNKNALAAAEFNNGKEHAIFTGLRYKDIVKLKKEKEIADMGVREYLGYGKLKNGKQIVIEGYDKKSIELNAYTIYKGRLPLKKNEIAIEKWMLDNLRLKRKCGQILKLNMLNGYINKNNKYHTYTGKAQFKLVGILNDNYQSKQSNSGTAMTVHGTSKSIYPHEDVLYNAFIRIKSHRDMIDKINKIKQKIHNKNLNVYPNNGLAAELELLEPGEDSNYWNESPKAFFNQNIPIILAVLIIIYNIFNMTIMSRMPQLGIMRAIGAKPSQIRRLIFGEALYISLFSIPLGLLTGLGFAKLFIVIGARNMGKAAESASKLYIPQMNCFLGIMLIVIAVLLAVAIPAYRAGKASPLETISGKTGYISTKKNKTGVIYRFMMKKFGISLNIALQNIWRNRKRAFITVLCMCICGVLYIGENNKQDSLKNYAAKSEKAHDKAFPFCIYDGEYSMENHKFDTPLISSGYSQKVYENILDTKGIKSAEAVREDWKVKLISDKEHITDNYSSFMNSEPFTDSERILFGNNTVRSTAMGVRTDILKKCSVFLQNGKIDIGKMKKKPIVLLINTIENYKKRKIIDVTKYKVGDTVKLKFPFMVNGKREERTYSCIIGGILSYNSGICLQTAGGMPGFIFHNDMMKKLANTSLYQGIYVTLDKGLSKESTKKISAKMKSIALSIPQGNFTDSTKEDAQSKSMSDQEKVIELAILWSLIIIAVVNIFNTASTNLHVRTREFGLMKIVGITARQLKGIVFVEMAIYGVVSTIFAFLGGLISGYKDIHGIEYIISWRSLIIVFCSYMVFSLLAAVMPLRRIIKSNAVESIRMVE